MYVYVDESGHPHPNDSHDRPVVACVCLRPQYVRHVSPAFHNLTQGFQEAVPNLRLRKGEREGKATEFLSRSNLLRLDAKRRFAQGVVDLIRDTDLAVLGMVMERPNQPLYRGDDYLRVYYRWLLERVEAYMSRRAPDQYATIIFDGRDPVENKRLDSCFCRFLFRHPDGRDMTHIVPSVHFVDSELTPGVKLADFVAYILRVYYEQELDENDPQDEYEEHIARYGEIVRAKSFNYTDQYGQQWGIRTLGSNHFRYA